MTLKDLSIFAKVGSDSYQLKVSVDGDPVELEIYAPKDQTDGGYLESFSKFPMEHELLLNAGNSYRVMDAGVRMATLRSETTNKPEEKEEYFVKLELLPRGSKSY